MTLIENAGYWTSPEQYLVADRLEQAEKVIDELVAGLREESNYQRRNYGSVAYWIDEALTSAKAWKEKV